MNGTMGELEIFYRVGLALAIGFLIGAERGWYTRELTGELRRAGIRTFTLVGLLGGLWGLLAQIAGELILAAAFLGLAALMTVDHWVSYRRAKGAFGTTTLVALFVTFALGALAVLNDMALAAAAAVVTMAVLQIKPELHRWVAAIERFELNSAIKLLLISVVALPLLPDKGYGPDGILNPFQLWWMVVLISGLSFIGYVTIKLIGPRLGALLTGIFGGLASSTAVTLNFARLSRHAPDIAPALAGGTAAAAAMMFLRVIVVSSVIDPALGWQLAPILGVMAIVTAIGAVILVFGAASHENHAPPDIRDPADLTNALLFGLLLAVLVVASHYLQQWAGEESLLLIAGAAGLVDVDAITLTMSRMAGTQISGHIAELAIIIAVVTNTVIKAGLAAVIGNGAMARRTGIVLALGLASGLIVWLVK